MLPGRLLASSLSLAVARANTPQQTPHLQSYYAKTILLRTAWAKFTQKSFRNDLLQWRSTSTSSKSSTPSASPPSPSSSSSDSFSVTSSTPSIHHASDQSTRVDRFSEAAEEEILQLPATNRTPIGKIQRRLSLTFTCTVPDCSTRSSHEFSRHAYEKGIVLIQCPGCQTRHLIADHLGWFDGDDLTQGGKYKTIEDILQAKGEKVMRSTTLLDGTIQVNAGEV